MKTEEIYKKALELHKSYKGKIQVVSKVPFKGHEDLAYYYTPGVAAVCGQILKDKDSAYEFTNKGNLIAVVSDGTRVLGLGDIGPEAAMPVMEGKALLFKLFGGVDAVPICINTKDADKIIELIHLLRPTFGGINLEDISKPKCFHISDTLEKTLDIPYWHDDHHGTGLVVLAGMINALKVIGKKPEDVRVTVGGTGAAGMAIVRFLLKGGIRGKNMIVFDSEGIIHKGREGGMDQWKEEIAQNTNPEKKKGGLYEALEDADAFVTATKTGPWIKSDAIKRMNKGGIVFSMANPVPEINPEEAKKGGARIVATGRSDYPNQINNVLGFPGVFRGALDVRAKKINREMILAAAETLAKIAEENGLSEENIVPKATDPEVGPRVAAAVATAAVKSGVARIKLSEEDVIRNTQQMLAQHKIFMENIRESAPSNICV
ncbi:MAG TPA: NAD(P)-dependent malic enzyme [Candidatus Avalokitesvara rifleensis]|uniref:NAD(P)-dependent malic enzyme n=1 Tax=Candidatus Avalokitesvara rifleensis TaxID=3367620 RepID=UPI002712E685|nr:NADP-dependent malic enzyme [Candidatus Brocadiales bacterium]